MEANEAVNHCFASQETNPTEASSVGLQALLLKILNFPWLVWSKAYATPFCQISACLECQCGSSGQMTPKS